MILDIAHQIPNCLMLAGRDEDAEVLASMRNELGEIGGVVVVGPPEAVCAARDKGQTHEFMTENVSFASTASNICAASLLVERVGWPLVLKPRFGFASRGVRLVWTLEELHAEMNISDVAQEYLGNQPCGARPIKGLPSLQYDEYSVQLLLGPGSQLLGMFASRNVLKDGRPALVEPVSADWVESFSRGAGERLAAVGAIGPWNLQGKLTKDGTIRLFEVNARNTGITGLRASLGFNEVDILYDAFVLSQDPGALSIDLPGGLVIDATCWTTG